MTTPTKHPDPRPGRIYTEAFQEAYAMGFSHVDAREYAQQAVDRAEREGRFA